MISVIMYTKISLIKKSLFCSKSEFYDDYKNFIGSINSINEYLYKVNEDKYQK